DLVDLAEHAETVERAVDPGETLDLVAAHDIVDKHVVGRRKGHVAGLGRLAGAQLVARERHDALVLAAQPRRRADALEILDDVAGDPDLRAKAAPLLTQ